MLIIPKTLFFQYKTLLSKRNIPENIHVHYQRWLRYYLDFCKKYNFPSSSIASLEPFIQKLREKNQNNFKQQQARDAVRLYYELIRPVSSNNEKKGSIISQQQCLEVREDVKPHIMQSSCRNAGTGHHAGKIGINKDSNDNQRNQTNLSQDWKAVFTRLSNEIKVRHYSPKTLQAYSAWLRKFQYFVKGKEPQTLSSDMDAASDCLNA